jgi:hypothetical protein
MASQRPVHLLEESYTQFSFGSYTLALVSLGQFE